MNIAHLKIDSYSKREVDSFVLFWNEHLKSNKYLVLDYSWPSLTVVDLITFSLRHKINLTEDESRLLMSASVYVSCVIASVTGSEAQPAEIFKDQENNSILRFAISNKTLEVNVEEIIAQVFRDIKNTLPISSDFKRPVSYDSIIVTPLSLSIAAGISPLIPKEQRGLSSDESIGLLQKSISNDLGRWFARNFPKNEMSHVPELYLKGFIWPPLLMEEEPPLTAAVESLLSYFADLQLPASYIFSLLEAFSLCPDEHVASIAIAMSGVFKKTETLSPCILASSRSRRYLTPLLRSALVSSALSAQSIDSDWMETGINSKNRNFFELEKEIGSIPWLSLSPDWIAENFSEIQVFLKNIKEFEFVKGMRLLDELVSQKPFEVELRIQQIKFEFIRGDYEKCHALCKTLVSEPKAESFPEFFNLWGLCLLSLNEPEIAARYFRAAKAIKHTDPALKAEILNNLAWSNIQLDNFDSAKSDLLEAEVLSLCPVTIWLNLAFISTKENDLERRNVYIKKASQIAPYDRRVFGNLV